MQEDISKIPKFNIFKTKNYFRNLDKQIFVSFIFLFILGIFFSFSSTSFIADERLNKGYYFLFSETSFVCRLIFFINDYYLIIRNQLSQQNFITYIFNFFNNYGFSSFLVLRLREQKDGWIFIYFVFSLLNSLNLFLF